MLTASTSAGRIGFRPMTCIDLPIAAEGRRLPAGERAALVIDPDPSNERAVRAWRRARVAGDRLIPGPDGDPVLIPERWPETGPRT